MTLGNLIITIVKQLGVSHVFGVPGDYNLRFLDYIIESDSLSWIGNCNELNGSYAADGYARENGIGVLVTTCGVGELSAANGIAGSYAHNVSVLHIVGYPNSKLLESDAPVHHTLGNYKKNSFLHTFSAITGAQTILTPTNYLEELQRVILHMLLTKKPAYIGIPTDLIDMEISHTIEAILFYPKSSDDGIIETLGNLILERFLSAQKPLFFLGANIARFGLRELVTQILQKTKAPFGTTLMGKSIINETSVAEPNFLGIYAGDYSTEGMVGIVQHSDCIISIGTVETDLNSGGFSEDGIDFDNVITIRPYSVKVGKTLYSGIDIEKLLVYILKHAKPNPSTNILPPKKENVAPLASLECALNHKDFWSRINHNIIQEGDIVVAEAGSSLFGLVQQNLPAGIDFVSQILWASIGYTLPSAIGSAIASPHRRVLLFIGDGSFQLTAQETSLIAQHNLNITVFLINNNGYTIERAIHGATQPYNDIPSWKYLDLVKALGIKTTFSIKTFKELEEHYECINQTGPKVVELFFEPLDFPPLLKQISNKLEAANRK